MRRDHWRRYTDSLDPEKDFVEITRVLTAHEFPWDITQALSFALFRTYAVPGVGRLLADTRAFTHDTQKRYDDTALLLEAPFRSGFDSVEGKQAIRRINQMHNAYDIPNHEMLYVLSTFVVVPVRWIEQYGKRPLTRGEVRATVNYYRHLGKHMAIKGMPDDYLGFAALMDDYEAQHFAFDEGGRAVADSTLGLLNTFYPKQIAPLIDLFSRSVMDEPLRRAFRYEAPPRWVEKVARGGLKARGRLLRTFPARAQPKLIEDIGYIRSYPDGYQVEALGTFPSPGLAGCPVRHDSASG